jgi:hypothetical protein
MSTKSVNIAVRQYQGTVAFLDQQADVFSLRVLCVPPGPLLAAPPFGRL